MTRAQEAAIARVCAHECLQRELVEALESVMQWIDGWSPEFTYDPEWPADRDKVRAVLARVKEQAA